MRLRYRSSQLRGASRSGSAVCSPRGWLLTSSHLCCAKAGPKEEALLGSAVWGGSICIVPGTASVGAVDPLPRGMRTLFRCQCYDAARRREHEQLFLFCAWIHLRRLV